MCYMNRISSRSIPVYLCIYVKSEASPVDCCAGDMNVSTEEVALHTGRDL